MKDKMTEAIFSFEPQEFGTFEAFYNFYIPNFDENVLFLLVGMAREPCIYFNTPFVTMRPTIKGIDIKEQVYLINKENSDFRFRVLPESLFSEGRLFRIKMDPVKGVISSSSEIKFKYVSFLSLLLYIFVCRCF